MTDVEFKGWRSKWVTLRPLCVLSGDRMVIGQAGARRSCHVIETSQVAIDVQV